MYRRVKNRSPSPSMEPEDLSPHPSSAPSRSSSAGPNSSGGYFPLADNRLLLFCDIVLKHVNYPHAFSEPCDDEQESSEESKGNIIKNERASESPLNSVGESARESTRSSTSSTDSVLAELDPEEVDKATYESVTCWCGKPFAGRPMIECDQCLVWYHMSCEAVRRNNIPNQFLCSACKESERQWKKRQAPKSDSPRKGKKKKVSPSSSTVTSPSVPLVDSRGSNDSIASPQHQPQIDQFSRSVSTPFSSVESKQASVNSSGILNDLHGPPPTLFTSVAMPTKVPPPPPVVNSSTVVGSAERKKSKGSSSRPRQKKSKSLGSEEGKRRSSGGGANNSFSASTSAAMTTSPSSVLNNSNGLSVGASSGGLANVPILPPPLLPYNPPHSGLVVSQSSNMSPSRKEQIYGDIDASSRSLFSTSAQRQMPVLTPPVNVAGLGNMIPSSSTTSPPSLVDHHKFLSQGTAPIVSNGGASSYYVVSANHYKPPTHHHPHQP